MAMSSELRRPLLRDALAQRVPAVGVFRRHVPGLELQFAAWRRASRRRPGAAPSESARSHEATARESRSPPGSSARARAPPARRTAGAAGRTRPATPSSPGRPDASAGSTLCGGRDRVKIEIDRPDPAAAPRPAPCGRACRSRSCARPRRGHVARRVDRAQVAHGRLAAARSPRGSRCRGSRGARVRPGSAVWLQARLRLVLEGHPAVAGLGERAHHARRRGRAP